MFQFKYILKVFKEAMISYWDIVAAFASFTTAGRHKCSSYSAFDKTSLIICPKIVSVFTFFFTEVKHAQ